MTQETSELIIKKEACFVSDKLSFKLADVSRYLVAESPGSDGKTYLQIQFTDGRIISQYKESFDDFQLLIDTLLDYFSSIKT